MPTYLNSRSGRIKLTNTNLMYHSADKGYFNFFKIHVYLYIFIIFLLYLIIN